MERVDRDKVVLKIGKQHNFPTETTKFASIHYYTKSGKKNLFGLLQSEMCFSPGSFVIACSLTRVCREAKKDAWEEEGSVRYRKS